MQLSSAADEFYKYARVSMNPENYMNPLWLLWCALKTTASGDLWRLSQICWWEKIVHHQHVFHRPITMYCARPDILMYTSCVGSVTHTHSVVLAVMGFETRRETY